MFRNSIQDEMNILLSMIIIPSNDVLESLYKLRIRESAQLKKKNCVGIVRHGDSPENIGSQLSKVENHEIAKF